jgi:GntR family transcriptional regulator
VTLPQSSIDRQSPIPFYFQLKKLLSEEIESGRWAPGDRLPSEPAICHHFGVSRTTVRQALAELEAEGAIRKDKGRGSFVAERPSSGWLLQSSHGFYEGAARDGHTVTSRVLRREVGPLPRWAVDALRLPPTSTTGLTLERLRWVDGRLVMYVLTHLPAALADAVMDADLAHGSLYQTLEQSLGITVVGGRRVVEAVLACGDLPGLLEVDEGAPLLFVESVSFGPGSRPFECYRAWHRADRTKIEVQAITPEAATRAGLEPVALRIGEQR